MAGDPLHRVLPGQPIQIPAAAVNAWNDAARFVRNQQHNNRTGFTAPVRRADLVRVQNKSEEPRDRFDILGIDRPIFLPSDNLDSFSNEVLLVGVTPKKDDHAGRFCVLLEPLEEDAIGWAVVTGVVPVRVKLEGEHPEDATGDRFADVLDGDCTRLRSGAHGSAHILWMEDPDEAEGGDDDTYWAVVRVGSPFPEGEAADNAIYGELLSSLPAGGAATMAVLNASGPAGTNVTVNDNLMASGQSLAAGSICWAHWHSVDQRWYVYAVDACPDGDGVVIRNHGDLVGLNGDHHLHYSLRDGSRWTTTQTPSRVVISNVDGHLVCSTITTTELAALDGIAGNIEDRLDALEAGGGTGGFTANRVIISDGSGDLAASDITATELDYLDGVSSNIQTQLDGKAASSHSHAISDVTGLSAALAGKADSVHSHSISDVTGLSTALAGKADANHTHDIEDIDGLEDALAGKSNTGHGHAASDITSGTFNDARIAQSNVTQHQGAIDHGSIAGLTGDHHSQYALLAGRSGGQALTGGTGAGEALTLAGTSHSTKGPLIVPNAIQLPIATVTANTTLTAAHYEVLCANDDGDGDITVDVADDPSTCPGRRYRVQKIHTDATTVEVQDDSGNPLETLYVAGDWVEIASDGTAWRVVGGYLTPHACTMRRTAVQSGIASSSFNKILFDTVSRDKGGLANVANSRAILRRAGDYRIQCDVWLAAGGADLQVVEPYIYVDESLYQLTRNQTRTGGTFNSWGSICIEEQFGAGTIIEAYVNHLAGSNKSTLTGGQAPFMTITEVR